MTDTIQTIAHGPGVCILPERDLAPGDGFSVRQARAQLAARSLTAALDPACPHDAQLLSAIERWRYGDHA